MKENETIADIVAEMRKVKGFPVPYAPSGHNGVWTEDLVGFADRIEAAWKREIVSRRSIKIPIEIMPKCNAAAMLKAFKKLDEELSFCERNVELWIGLALEGLREHCRIVREILKTALSAPPRNCDRYSHDEALAIWAAEKENGENGCFDEWLYQNATEQKGDTDGSK